MLAWVIVNSSGQLPNRAAGLETAQRRINGSAASEVLKMPGSEDPTSFVSKNPAANFVVNRLRVSRHIRFDENNGSFSRQNKTHFSAVSRLCSDCQTAVELSSQPTRVSGSAEVAVLVAASV